MLRRINTMKNVGRFSGLTSDNKGHQNSFDKLNVIYAPNASGKTTLCDGLRSLGLQQGNYIIGRQKLDSDAPPEIELLLHGSRVAKASFSGKAWKFDPATTPAPKVWVYDERFINENVLIGQYIDVDHKRNLYGLAIGANAIKLQKAVDAAEKELTAATTEFNAASATLTKLIPQNMTINSYKALPNEATIDQQIADTTEALNLAKTRFTYAQPIKNRATLKLCAVPVIPTGIHNVLETTLDDIALQAEEQVREHLKKNAPTLTIGWIKQGHEAMATDVCPHCGRSMEGVALLKAYQSLFSGILEEQQKELDRIKKELETGFGAAARKICQETIEAHKADQEWWQPRGLEFSLPADVTVGAVTNSMTALYDRVSAAVKRKQENPGKKVTASEEENAVISAFEELAIGLKNYNDQITKLNEKIVAHKATVDSVDTETLEAKLALLQNQKKRHMPEAIATFDAYDKAEVNKAKKSTEKEKANKALRAESTSILTNYGERINQLLKSFGMEIKIVPSVTFPKGTPASEVALQVAGKPVKNTLKDAKDPSVASLANTLSAGDRSALALAFFLAFVEEEPDLPNTIVVFDDPFTSQDMDRREKTVVAIQNIAKSALQTFVLSHDLEFACRVAQVPKLTVRTFKIHPTAQPAMIRAVDFSALAASSYEVNYKTLASFLEDCAQFDGDEKKVVKCIRQALEKYLRVKYPAAGFKDEAFGKMLGKIAEAPAGSPMDKIKHLLPALNEVNEWTQGYYHAENDTAPGTEINVKELKTHVEQALEIIHQ